MKTPARNAALWLACIPLLLPAPVISLAIIFSGFTKGSRDPKLPIVMALATANIIISTVVLVKVNKFIGAWMVDRINEFIELFLS